MVVIKRTGCVVEEKGRKQKSEKETIEGCLWMCDERDLFVVLEKAGTHGQVFFPFM